MTTLNALTFQTVHSTSDAAQPSRIKARLTSWMERFIVSRQKTALAQIATFNPALTAEIRAAQNFDYNRGI